MSSTISSTTPHSWRERPASSYSLKVQILSKLQSSTLYSDGKYQSRRFSSGGYNWRLIIYPKGDNKDNGSGFISMYIEIDSTSLMSTPSSEVYADLRFFVFNKKEDKYFTIQVVEPKPFNTLRTVWGLPQVLALDTFNDLENGYVFDGDHCEFGVDVIVAPPPTKLEILSFDVKLPYPKFSWSVKNFSEIKVHCHTSDSFSMGGREWVLSLYPKGDTTANSKWLSIFLFLADGEILSEDEKVYVEADVNVADPHGSNHLSYKLNWWFEIAEDCFGWDQYVSLADLRKTYLDMEDTFEVEIEFKVVSSTKYSSFT